MDRNAVNEIGAPEPALPDDAFRFRRDDLALLVADYLRESRSRRQLATAVAGMAGLALGPTLIMLGDRLGWSPSLAPVFFFGGWAILLGCLALMFRRARHLRQKYQFACQSCDALLLSGIRDLGGLARIRMIGATGVCPDCGAQLCDP